MDLNKLCGIKPYQENTNISSIHNSNIFDDNDDYFKEILKSINKIPLPSKTKNNNENNNKLIIQKKEYHMKRINEYYNKLDDETIKKIINIINRKSNISLRLIEWFILKYSNKINSLDDNNKDYFIPINILNSYHIKTKLYQKKYFDLFRRHDVFIYKFKNRDDLQMTTTISQLNFFQWLIENNIFNYIENHIDELSKIMAEYNAKEDDERDRKKNIENNKK